MKMSDRRIYPDELAHFGILGMKWGKRNGPPYPIADKDHSASEKKAGWRKSLKDKIRDRDDEYRYRQATKIRRQLDGSVPGGMQIRKLGRSQYKIEPVDPNQRRKIYKNGTIVPDYKSGRDRSRETTVSDAAQYARTRERAHLSSAKHHQAEYDKLRKKSPDTILGYRSAQSGIGRNAKHYKVPFTVKDQMRIEKDHIERHRTLAKNWSAWAKTFEGPMDSLDKRDFKFAKKYAKYQHGGKLSILDRSDYIDTEQ